MDRLLGKLHGQQELASTKNSVDASLYFWGAGLLVEVFDVFDVLTGHKQGGDRRKIAPVSPLDCIQGGGPEHLSLS